MKSSAPTINSFIYTADFPSKVNRKIQYEHLNPKNAEKRVKRMDQTRAAYYQYRTGSIRGDKSAYHLCIGTSKNGVATAIDLIAFYNEKRKGE